MARYEITNNQMKAVIESKGAELLSLMDCKTGEEFMWNANPKHWNRTSPILFPFIGGLKNKEYHYQGKTYAMEKHGFVRDAEFQMTKHTDNEVWFSYCANEETLKVYPFAFLLEIGYVLENKKMITIWKVRNTENKEMYFSIGGHPAINCPRKSDEKQTDYFLGFNQKEKLVNTLIGSDGLAANETVEIYLNDGLLQIPSNLFEKDALVIEDYQLNEITFMDAGKNPYVKVCFDTSVVGIWAPVGGAAPFICIEPWEGICDFTNFNGNLEDRKWQTYLKAGEEFKKQYSIEIVG